MIFATNVLLPSVARAARSAIDIAAVEGVITGSIAKERYKNLDLRLISIAATAQIECGVQDEEKLAEGKICQRPNGYVEGWAFGDNDGMLQGVSVAIAASRTKSIGFHN